MKYLIILMTVMFSLNSVCQQMDSCEVFVIIHKKHPNIRYIKHKGDHSMIKLNNGERFPTAEWLNFNDTQLHITKGFNAIKKPYVGDTIINISDIKWVFWDGMPRKYLRSKKYYYTVEKIYTNCEYKGWNHLYFKNEEEIR